MQLSEDEVVLLAAAELGFTSEGRRDETGPRAATATATARHATPRHWRLVTAACHRSWGWR